MIDANLVNGLVTEEFSGRFDLAVGSAALESLTKNLCDLSIRSDREIKDGETLLPSDSRVLMGTYSGQVGVNYSFEPAFKMSLAPKKKRHKYPNGLMIDGPLEVNVTVTLEGKTIPAVRQAKREIAALHSSHLYH